MIAILQGDKSQVFMGTNAETDADIMAKDWAKTDALHPVIFFRAYKEAYYEWNWVEKPVPEGQ